MTDAVDGGTQRLVDLPPSCRYVLHVLEANGRLTRQELLAETGLPKSTLDDALRALETRHLVLLSRKEDDLNQVTAEIQD